MPRLIAALMRHADYQKLNGVPSAHQPFPLTAKGEVQAVEAAQDLCRVLENNGWRMVEQIDSSGLLRAWQTARGIANGLAQRQKNTSVHCFDELAERGLGSAANLSVTQIEDVLRQDPRFSVPPDQWKADSDYCLPLLGAESLMQAGKRVAAHLSRRMQQLEQREERNSVKVFVGHGAAFRHAAFHLGVLEFEQIAQFSMYHARPVFLEYIPGQAWQHIEGDWKVRSTRLKQ